MKKVDTTDDAKAAGRPRDARTTRRILDATLELGLGFDGLTVEGVVARASARRRSIGTGPTDNSFGSDLNLSNSTRRNRESIPGSATSFISSS